MSLTKHRAEIIMVDADAYRETVVEPSVRLFKIPNKDLARAPLICIGIIFETTEVVKPR